MRWLSALALTLTLTLSAWSCAGSNLTKCVTMSPAGLYHHYALPQTSPLPFQLTLEPTEVTDSDLVYVTISSKGGRFFRGFMAQARADGSDYPLGIFYPEDEKTKLIDCTNERDTAFQTSVYLKTNVTFSWDPPPGFHGKVQIYVSVVESPAIFWVKQSAGTVTVT